ncbi:MAG: ABC transporter permease, partial [Clostridia bacterium]|nr:ABC transporter permease [Clostridia bacterium]
MKTETSGGAVQRALPRDESVLRQLWRDGLGRAGLLGIMLIVALAVFAPLIMPYGMAQMHPKDKLAPPDLRFLFGTDNFGRDVFSRIVYGARVSLVVGVVSVSIAAGFGYMFGMVAGFFEGGIESVIMTAMDIVFAFRQSHLCWFL